MSEPANSAAHLVATARRLGFIGYEDRDLLVLRLPDPPANDASGANFDALTFAARDAEKLVFNAHGIAVIRLQ